MRWRLSSIRLHSSVVNANILATGAILENPVKELVDLETVIVLIIERYGRIQRIRVES